MRPGARTAAVVLVLALVGAAAIWSAQRLGAPTLPATAATAAADRQGTPAVDEAAELLRDWDARRAAAYASADVAALRRLYADGSIAGRRDIAVLRSYRARGLRVVGLTTQVLTVRSEHRAEGEAVLLVTDRLAGAVAVGPDRRVRLPAGVARTRRVTFVDEGRGWVVAEVRAGTAG